MRGNEVKVNDTIRRLRGLEKIITKHQQVLMNTEPFERGAKCVFLRDMAIEISTYFEATNSRLSGIHGELDVMKGKGLLSRTAFSAGEKEAIQALVGEISDIVTDIQLELLTMTHGSVIVSIRPLLHLHPTDLYLSAVEPRYAKFR